MSLNLNPGPTVIDTRIQQTNFDTDPDPSLVEALQPLLPSRVMVIPLAPIDPWVLGNVRVFAPPQLVNGTVHVTLLVGGEEIGVVFINVLFWDPSSLVGPVSADPYN